MGDRKDIRPSSSSPVVTTTYIILCFSKHQLTQIYLENGH